MTLGLFPEETSNALDTLNRMPPAGAPQPGFFAGLSGAVASGVEEGAVKSAFALTPDSPTAPQSIGMPPIGAPDWAYDEYAQRIKKAHEVDPDAYKQQLTQDTAQALKGFAPDPATVGTAGQLLHGVASGAARLIAGAALAGPVGGAVAVGGSEGVATTRQFSADGVDADTAAALGAGAALFSGAGALLPGGVGSSLAQRVASGAAIQSGAGMLNRQLTHSVLDAAGYPAQAQQYKAIDGMAIMSDAVLGAAFGGIHHAFLPSDIDAALTARGAVHREVDSAPGIPVDAAARAQHIDQMTRAAQALFNDEPVAGMEMPRTIPNPAQDALGATSARDLSEASAEATDAVVGPESTFAGPERRADAIEAQRLADLSHKHATEGLSPAETNEWAALLNKRRLTTRVAGRTIRGVGSYEAYAEMVARGEQKPVVGFADSDMLHATNAEHGYPVGDELIRATGETLAHYFGEGNVFRRSGEGGGSDEFITHADTPEAHDAAMAAAQRHLANHTLRAYDPVTGALIGEKKGAAFSHGRGHDETSAVAAAKADKQRRAAEGLRRERDDPRPVDTQPAGGKPADTGDTPVGSEAAGVAALDPETRESVEQAQAILARRPELAIAHPDTNTETSATDALAQSMDDLSQAKESGVLHQIAAACFGRG